MKKNVFDFSRAKEARDTKMGWGTLQAGRLEFRIDFDVDFNNFFVNGCLCVCLKRIYNSQYGTTHVVQLTTIENCPTEKAEQPAVAIAKRVGDNFLVAIPMQAIQDNFGERESNNRQAKPYCSYFTLVVKDQQGWLVPTPQVWNDQWQKWKNELQPTINEAVEDYGLTVPITSESVSDDDLDDFFNTKDKDDTDKMQWNF